MTAVDLQAISRACARCRAPFMPRHSAQTACRRCRELPDATAFRTVADAVGADQVARILEAVS